MNGSDHCTFCNGPIDPATDYRRASGWTQDRGAVGGVHALRLREWQDEYACSTCIGKLARGIPVEQETLL